MKPLPRLFIFTLITIIVFLFVCFNYPAQLAVSIYKINLIMIGGVAGYWLDRTLFPYARPDQYNLYASSQSGRDGIDATMHCNALYQAAQYRRAIIIASVMIAVGLGA